MWQNTCHILFLFFMSVCVSPSPHPSLFCLKLNLDRHALVSWFVCLCFHFVFACPSCSHQKHRIHKVNEHCLRVPFFFTHNDVFYVCWPGFVASVVVWFYLVDLSVKLSWAMWPFFPLSLFFFFLFFTVASPFECGLSCLLLLSWFP